MELKKLTIHNYKSLVNFEFNEPNAFTVFAGPNGAGKSNIFEALEFGYYLNFIGVTQTIQLFGGEENFINFKSKNKSYKINLDFIGLHNSFELFAEDDIKIDINSRGHYDQQGLYSHTFLHGDYRGDFSKVDEIEKKFFNNFTRLFIANEKVKRILFKSNYRLLPDASNLESVLKRLLKDASIKEEFIEWLDLLVPGFSNIEIHSDNIGGTDTLLIYEEGTKKPFTKNLISDGTYNILALLTAVYQTNEPQFLCIEEPENGLNPYVVETFVDFFRRQCEEKGHVIWLNTHSQTLVKHLRPEELVLVEKKNGETVIKQFPADYNLYSFTMDEAWLTNVLGGGLPW